MFGWLADLLVKAPVVGSNCSCCEGQKEQLKKMQKAVLSGEFEETEESSKSKPEKALLKSSKVFKKSSSSIG